MNVFKLILAFFIGSSLFAVTPEDVIRKIECDALKCQPCQEDPCDPCCKLIPAYNAPSRPEGICSWDWYVTGSAIYWQAIQENMALAEYFDVATRGDSSIPSAQQLNFQYKYKPGFKVLLGAKFDYDNWDLYAEYTWYHTNTMSTRYTAPGVFVELGAADRFSGPVLVSRSLAIGNTEVFSFALNEITKTWKLKLDFIDLMLARSFYVGKKLTFRSGIGARAAYIRQHLTLNEITHSPTIGPAPVVESLIRADSNRFFDDSILSWGYGLRTLFDGQYLIGAGFRILGNVAFDLLYTRYNLKQNFNSPNFPSRDLRVDHINTGYAKHADFLRPHGEVEFGFGYGNCFSNGRWYVDLEAAYGFQVFWDQNMTLMANSIYFNSLPTANLFLHGARFTARLDF